MKQKYLYDIAAGITLIIYAITKILHTEQDMLFFYMLANLFLLSTLRVLKGEENI